MKSENYFSIPNGNYYFETRSIAHDRSEL